MLAVGAFMGLDMKKCIVRMQLHRVQLFGINKTLFDSFTDGWFTIQKF